MPIRAYCTICSDYFDNFKDVAAIHCGHTFHSDCLAQWFHSAPSRTCPQCRIQVSARYIVNKLFFDVGEGEQVLDPETLQNELNSVKFQLLLKGKEKKDQQSIIDSLRNTLDKHSAKIESLTKKLNEAENLCSTLKKQVRYLEQQQDDSKSAKEEAHRLQQKLKTLENIQILLQTQRPEVEEMIQEVGVGQSATEQLSIYCVSLKKEYENLKATVKSSIDMSEKLKKDNFTSNCKNLKKKLEFLQKSLSTPNRTNEAISRLIYESPAPVNLQYPKLHKPAAGEDIDLCQTYDLNTPDYIPPTSPNASFKKIKLDTAGSSTPNRSSKFLNSKMMKKEEDDCLLPAFLQNSMLFRKKSHSFCLDSHTSQGSVRIGFDGLGGRTKFIEPTKMTEIRPLPSKARKKKATRVTVNRSTCHQPKLKDFLQ
ncbi:E3 ubiquitin-protein ligase TRAIP isoform X2 [Narcine bancroftii]|uniref:E3 ubiquitin-protein ligase TRAIP isoform X2 n=1 Tax=Narcine bancroftii TaxID=1343680 RepID=UPI003831F7C0